MATFRLTGQIAIRGNLGEGDTIKDHQEMVKAQDETEAVEVSLSGFTEEQEPCWCKPFKVEQVFTFNFEAYTVAIGGVTCIPIDTFTGTHREMETHLREQLAGWTVFDEPSYTQRDPD